MLPRLLCEKLCSLNGGVKRFAFSCSFLIKENGEIIENSARIEKSIIRSCAKLSYECAQKIFEGEVKELEDFPENMKPVGRNITFFFFLILILISFYFYRSRC